MTGKPGKCRSCGAAVRWVLTTAGKWMPLDALPVASGNVAIGLGGTAVVIGKNGAGDDLPGARYVSHHATCPNAAEHRKGKS